MIHPGERPLHALRDRGVEYVEVRLMDLDPFHAIGITASTVRLLDVFLLHCLLADSPPDTPQELAAIVRNKQRVASRGREPGLRLTRGTDEVTLSDWGAEILAECAPIAAALDAANGGSAHRDALASAVAALRRSRVDAVGARAAGDGARPRQFVRSFRARAVARASRSDPRSCRSPTRSPRATRGLPRSRSPSSGRSKRRKRSRSKPTGSSISRRCA